MDRELEIIWETIESWPVTDSVKGGSIFNSGAPISEIELFEKEIGLALPRDVVDSFLRHDGMPKENGWYCFWDGNFLSLKESLKERNERIRVTKEINGEPGSPDYYPPDNVIGPVKPLIWSSFWIPVLKKNKEPVCIDFDPPKGGVSGQVIEVDWEGSEVKVIASSFREFLYKVVDSL